MLPWYQGSAVSHCQRGDKLSFIFPAVKFALWRSCCSNAKYDMRETWISAANQRVIINQPYCRSHSSLFMVVNLSRGESHNISIFAVINTMQVSSALKLSPSPGSQSSWIVRSSVQPPRQCKTCARCRVTVPLDDREEYGNCGGVSHDLNFLVWFCHHFYTRTEIQGKSNVFLEQIYFQVQIVPLKILLSATLSLKFLSFFFLFLKKGLLCHSFMPPLSRKHPGPFISPSLKCNNREMELDV